MGETETDPGATAKEHERAASVIAELSQLPGVVIQNSEVQAGASPFTECTVTFRLKKHD